MYRLQIKIECCNRKIQLWSRESGLSNSHTAGQGGNWGRHINDWEDTLYSIGTIVLWEDTEEYILLHRHP